MRISAPLFDHRSLLMDISYLKKFLICVALLAVCLFGTSLTQAQEIDPQQGNKPLQPLGKLVALPNTSTGEDGDNYQWKQDTSYGYKIQIKAKVDRYYHNYNGYVQYLSTGESPSSLLKDTKDFEGELEEDSIGSGFVVHPEGVIATCAHVVTGAKSIEVNLNGKTYDAKVVAYNLQKDLALLKIEANNLLYIPLVEPDQVELAQEVRVVGYPLSTTLGESIKISRGTISGMASKADGGVLQVDATVNPGNSGGPLVDEQGRVVGVASSLLSGEKISNVGFAVPAEEVKKMMSNLKIPVAQISNPKTLTGPQLAKQVTPAVGLIRVKTGLGGFRFASPIVMRYNVYAMSINTLPGNRSGMVRGTGKMLVDPFGKTYQNEDVHELPYRLGALSKVGIEDLPSNGESEWETVGMTVVREKQSVRSPYGLTLPSIRIRSSLFAPAPRDITHIALERIRYKVISKTNKVTKIEKTHTLSTVEEEGDIPYLSLTGKGSFEINTELGITQKCEMNYKLSVANESRSTLAIIPFTFNYAYLEKPAFDSYVKEIRGTLNFNSPKASSTSKKNSNPVRKVPAQPATSIKSGPSTSGLNKFDPNK